MCVIERISCHNYVVADGYAYFSNWFYNGLFKVEIPTGKTYFLGHFDGEKCTVKNLHWEVFAKNEKIYFCPRRSRYIHIYNLEKESLCSVEIRRKSEEFFRIEDVVLNENNLFLIPENMDFFCELDINSLEVTRIKSKSKPEGISLTDCKENFPAKDLIQKYKIEPSDRFWWRQILQSVWYGFLPFGRCLLKYTEGRDDLEIIPLIVVNEATLKEYLCYVEWRIWKEKSILRENRDTDISRVIEIFTKVKANKRLALRIEQSSGKRIWKMMTDREC